MGNQKTMEVTLEQLRQAKDSLEKVAILTSFDVLIGHELGKLVNKVNTELNDLKNTHSMLVHKYGSKDEMGNVNVTDKNLNNFYADMDKILMQTVELPYIKIKLTELPNKTFSPVELASLDFLIEQE